MTKNKKTHSEPGDANNNTANDKIASDLAWLQGDGVSIQIEPGYRPNMRVPCRVFVRDELRVQLEEEVRQYYADDKKSFLPALHQIANVASLPGIVGASVALPDVHAGYGFAIGNVAAFDLEDEQACISPGGVGFDINCGVRLIRTNLNITELREKQEDLADAIFGRIPVGVFGHREQEVELTELRNIMQRGMAYAVEQGMAWPEDPDYCEDRGCIASANSRVVSQRAEARGKGQLGTLGSGNHYAEVQLVEEIYDAEAAAAMGFHQVGQIAIMVHCGSRGLGHQVATDAIAACEEWLKKQNGLEEQLNDRQLAFVPIQSEQGQRYLQGMAAAANFAFVNRSVITMHIRDAFAHVFGRDARDLGMHLVYDVAHNIAKEETHMVDGREKRLLVLRKGSTRAFPPQHPDLPAAYRQVGQPVLVGGSMGTCSYVLVGTSKAMNDTFGSTCHGAGRALSRNQALKLLDRAEVVENLKEQGITIKVANEENICEEAPGAYKDVTEVVNICKLVELYYLGHEAGISKKVLKLKPVIVVKG